VIFEPMVVEVHRARSLLLINSCEYRTHKNLSKELPSGSFSPIVVGMVAKV